MCINNNPDLNRNTCYDCGYPNQHCICTEPEYDDRCDDDGECDECGRKWGNHHFRCSRDISPYGDLLRDGYD